MLCPQDAACAALGLDDAENIHAEVRPLVAKSSSGKLLTHHSVSRSRSSA